MSELSQIATPLFAVLATLWAAWLTFFRDRRKDEGDLLLRAYEHVEAVKKGIREDFNLQILQLQSDITMLNTNLTEARLEAERERGLRLKAEQRIAALESILSTAGLPLNGHAPAEGENR